jgi:Putative collagen-binding domain of a collagenase
VMRKLFELRPWHQMSPDQSVIAMGQGEGEDRVQAARAEDGSFILAYSTFGHRIAVHMDKLSQRKIKAQWFDPREGTWTSIGQYSNSGIREFIPPSNGDQNDWVLVLENMGRNYPLEFSK